MDYRGIHHFGVLVEDVAESRRGSRAWRGYYTDAISKAALRYFEKKFYGPNASSSILPSMPAGAEPLPAEIKEARNNWGRPSPPACG